MHGGDLDRFVLYAALYHPDMHEELGINAHIAVVDFTAPAAMDGTGAKEYKETCDDKATPPSAPRSPLLVRWWKSLRKRRLDKTAKTGK